MRRYGKWVLTLGLAAATPSVSMADGFLSSIIKPKNKAAASATQAANQKTAEAIANAMRLARLTQYDINIACENGTATLTGAVQTADQKALATRIAESVPGVKTVNNKLATAEAATRAPQNTIQQTAAEFVQPVTPAAKPAAPAGITNQKMAENVARQLASAGLTGYDIQIRFKDGVCRLEGVVGSPDQRNRASQVASTVGGVRQVENRLGILQTAPPVQQVSHQAPQGGFQPTGYYPTPQGQPGMAPGSAMPVGLGSSNGGQPIYNMPNLPNHSWPTYASYPNYAQVNYPSQYSASAWPYIGPYYPYPQVPLGWRAAQLEWDDGMWHLNFKPRTERWWWFMQPKNW